MIRRTLAAVLALLVVAGCGTDSPAPPPIRVAVSGTGLTLDGAPWSPVGLNAYQLATNWSINHGCGEQTDLDAYFGALPPNTVTRFWLFDDLARNRKGQRDFRAADAVFAAARRHGQLLLPVLGNGEGACDGGFKQSAWYRGEWRTAHDSFATWIDTAVTRWRTEPTVTGWSLLNEAEVSDCRDAQCNWATRTCPADAATTLRGFFTAASAQLRALDPRRPLFAGLAGGGQCGTAGPDYAALIALPAVDVAEYHHYSDDGAAFPGGEFDGVRVRLAQARTVGKPLLVGEMGLDAGSGCRLSRDDRSRLFESTVTALRQTGAAGALLWSAVPTTRSGCTMDIGPHDPALALLPGQVAAQSSTAGSTR